MHDENTVQRFIELRANGWNYARLTNELNVTQPTQPAEVGRTCRSRSCGWVVRG